jgi:Mn-dependent DtxR family transcriptional regulator
MAARRREPDCLRVLIEMAGGEIEISPDDLSNLLEVAHSSNSSEVERLLLEFRSSKGWGQSRDPL